MLERQGLIIGPWQHRHKADEMSAAPGSQAAVETQPVSSSVRVRCIFDAATRTALGVVRSRPRPGWFLVRWLTRQTWDVLETEDESLLLSVVCPWGWVQPWEVYDAEDRLVCSIHKGEIFDSSGQLRARLVRYSQTEFEHEETGKQQFISADKVELAWLQTVPDGIELIYTDIVRDDPFAKMALLGAALAVAPRS